ncbi:GspE/PulE family protein [Candidatus Venteria ishoeyi]|uniref:Type II secretion system protein E n=1 Tax=Candidatus Venteria ishoeyi TaxID=1899563 RepID=A0A1H6FCF2_9GAMM|nr:GspE/PulE family protein [Candidatus Venteria ishoeyi]MDM8545009.1 GspE/PulE family protein [Candidatus Venteria ishoeyi]SEH06999.1 Type II secretion system protein E [Candidatus Venteria ishoeyi]
MQAHRKLGELLVEASIISQDQLKIALTDQKRNYQQLGKILVDLGFVSETVLRDFLSASYQQESIDLSQIVLDNEAIQMVPQSIAQRHTLLPVNYDAQKNLLVVAMADTFNVIALDQLTAHLGNQIEVRPVLSSERVLLEAIDTAYGFDLSLDGILHEIETGEVDYQSIANQDQYNQPLVRLVDALLTDAVKRGVSDIHFEPEQGFLRIRYRIDGVLEQVRSLHKDYWSAIAVRVKVMSDMNIAETRVPQDGRISLTLAGRPIDFRVSTQPTVYGENIVLRVLDREKGIVPLEKLGLKPEQSHLLELMLARPEGVILVTGPTGSGKTTTLYSILNYLNTEEVNIMTLEDPVEYHLSMVRQTSVNEAVKLDFAQGVRAILRQDPDIVLIGEIRDQETAEMGFRAAMTGHQVFSTLHTNSAIGSIPRLLDIGVLPDLLADNIIGIIGQRLVRRLCSHCKQAYSASELEHKLLGIDTSQALTLYQANGCPQCNQRGYKGRLALMEILRMNDTLMGQIAHKTNVHELKQVAVSEGFITLAEDGAQRVLAGDTDLEELSRVIDLTGRI